MRCAFVLGLDLGQTTDFTALAVLERRAAEAGEAVYALRHLQRFPLGTAYTQVVPAVARLANTEPLRGSPLVVDQTGVGRALVDMLRAAMSHGRIIPVTITAGRSVTVTEDGSHHVPKKELVTSLQLLVEGRRLQIARSLPEAATLVRELQSFQVRITAAAHEAFGAWREGQHDDLVLAVALACWWAERGPRRGPDAFGSGGEGVIARAPPGVFRT